MVSGHEHAQGLAQVDTRVFGDGFQQEMSLMKPKRRSRALEASPPNAGLQSKYMWNPNMGSRMSLFEGESEEERG